MVAKARERVPASNAGLGGSARPANPLRMGSRAYAARQAALPLPAVVAAWREDSQARSEGLVDSRHDSDRGGSQLGGLHREVRIQGDRRPDFSSGGSHFWVLEAGEL